MGVLEQFKDSKIATTLLQRVNCFKEEVRFMEVCGTHTVQFFKTGVKAGLNSNIQLLSGPGCPVCVTSISDIDKAIAIASTKNVILCCFGDMMKVPGTYTSLDLARGKFNANVKIIYSPIEALELAKQNPNKKVVMFGVGFETTVPAFASVLIRAKQQNIKNLFIFAVFKLIPPAIRALLESGRIKIDGFILPGHVSTIIGEEQYRFIVQEFNKPAVITGFEPVDLLQGLLFLIQMVKKSEAKISNEYRRSVNLEGNKIALDTVFRVFEKEDAEWRALGKISQSGLRLNYEFSDFNVDNLLQIKLRPSKENPNCICANVIKGLNSPLDCRLYAKKCTPDSPVGPCMVSSEGSCAAFYKYGERK